MVSNPLMLTLAATGRGLQGSEPRPRSEAGPCSLLASLCSCGSSVVKGKRIQLLRVAPAIGTTGKGQVQFRLVIHPLGSLGKVSLAWAEEKGLAVTLI